MYTVYVLRSPKTGRHYTGLTNCLERRILEHHRGYNPSTRGRGPFELVYSESFDTRVQARQREKQLKSGNGRKFLRQKLATMP